MIKLLYIATLTLLLTVTDARAGAPEQFSALCLAKFPAADATGKIRALRHCVNVNSDYRYKKNTRLPGDAEADQWLLDYATGRRKDIPPMECYYRSRALARLLGANGIKSSLVSLARNEDGYPGHVVLEVENPGTGAREIHDTTYDIDFRDAKTSAAQDLRGMLSHDLDMIEPCNFEGKCGWDLSRADALTLEQNKGYWTLGYNHGEATLYHAPDRISLDTPSNVKGRDLTYCEAFPGWCDKIVHLEKRTKK